MKTSLEERHTLTHRSFNWYVSTITDVFLNQKRVNVYIYTLLNGKYICDYRNVSVKFPCDYVCLSFRDLFIYSLFWLRNSSVIVKTYQWNFFMFICAFHLEISLLRVFTFLSLILWYSYFGTFLSTWSILIFLVRVSFFLAYICFKY